MGDGEVVGEPKKRRSARQRLDDTEALDAWLERHARAEVSLDDDEDEPEPLPEVAALHYPRWYVQRAWLRDREHGELPHGGALNTLPMALLQDWNTMDARYDYFLRVALKEKSEQMEQQSGGRSKSGKTPLTERLGEDFDGLMDGFEGAATAPIQWG